MARSCARRKLIFDAVKTRRLRTSASRNPCRNAHGTTQPKGSDCSAKELSLCGLVAIRPQFRVEFVQLHYHVKMKPIAATVCLILLSFCICGHVRAVFHPVSVNDPPSALHWSSDDRSGSGNSNGRLERSLFSQGGGSCLEQSEISENTIIRTKDSRALGARFLNETSLGLHSRDQCLSLCCSVHGCNVAVYEEKVKTQSQTRGSYNPQSLV